MKYLSLLIILVSVLFSIGATAQNPPADPSVNYEYKKYQKFDLGNLSIKGNILTPGDVSVRDRLPSSITHDVYDRKNFNDHMDKDIQDIR